MAIRTNQKSKLFGIYDVIMSHFRKKDRSGAQSNEPQAPRPKAKGRGEMLMRNAPPQAPPVESPILNLPSHHEKVAPKPVEKVAPPENNTAPGKAQNLFRLQLVSIYFCTYDVIMTLFSNLWRQYLISELL